MWKARWPVMEWRERGMVVRAARGGAGIEDRGCR